MKLDEVLSYQLDEELLCYLILRPDLRIIFISRRNLLQTAVSDRIAKQAKLWNRWDASPQQPLERYYGSLKRGGRQTYGRLPNAAEIDAALGADETGWLCPLVP